MNWIQSLYETYERCQTSALGYSSGSRRPLLPICHITVQAHIEIVIDSQGNFRRAQLVSRDEAVTIIPATEDSASRSGSKPDAHPLCDKLQYLVPDLAQYGGKITSGFQPGEAHNRFITQLSNWCEYSKHPKIQAVLTYVKKETLIDDLIRSRILLVNDKNRFLSKNDLDKNQHKGTIFEVLNDQSEAVVRWLVEMPGDPKSRLWLDPTIWESWITYYLNSLSSSRADVCFVTGKKLLLTNKHPKYIRREGDNAKLISSNDTRGFTFRGRFMDDVQACGVGLEVSHKAHYTLAWLIDRQGYREGDLAIVAWAIADNVHVPQPIDDPIAILFGDLPSEDMSVDTAQDIGIRLKKKIAGYRQDIGDRNDVAVIAVDSATPGRLAVVYYRLLRGSDFLDRVESWHETCAWRHTYRRIEEQGKKEKRQKIVPFIGAPAPSDIAEAAYGRRLDDRLKQATIKRLLPCIVDGQPLPRDLVEATVTRASNPAGLTREEHSKTLSIACALYRKYMYGKEKYDMALDEHRRTRDYLYGRLLAIADIVEERALYKAEQNRPTNALRYMHQFSQRPFHTWKQIHDLLTPYLMRLGSKAYYYKNLLAEVESMFAPEDFTSSRPLSGEYLLGYYCQRYKLFEKQQDNTADNDEIN